MQILNLMVSFFFVPDSKHWNEQPSAMSRRLRPALGPGSEYYLLNFLVTLTPKPGGIIDVRVKSIMRSGA